MTLDRPKWVYCIDCVYVHIRNIVEWVLFCCDFDRNEMHVCVLIIEMLAFVILFCFWFDWFLDAHWFACLCAEPILKDQSK